MPCPFCEIVAGRLPASIVYQDDTVMAFMDQTPMTPGHLLVIPKAHYRNIFDTPPEVAGNVMEVAARLAPAVRQATAAEGLNLHVSNEQVAGQVVWHLHLHILPRRYGDGFGLRVPPGYGHRPDRAELDEFARRIQAAAGES